MNNAHTTLQHRAMLAAILLVAVLLRAANLLQIEHNVDHAYPVWQALRMLDAGEFRLAGQGTSVLFANPALTGYLYAPFVALARTPLAVYVFVIALNTLAVLLAYRVTRVMLGVMPALIAAGLMAVNPWVIEYSRLSWPPALLPFAVTALAWLLWPVLLGRSHRPVRRTALALVMFTVMTQLYLLPALMIVPVGLLLVIFRRRVPRRGLLIGGAVLVIAFLLYGAGLLAEWETVQQRIGDFTGGGAAQLSGEALGHALRLVSGADYAAARGTQAPIQDHELRQALSQFAQVGITAALVVGAALAMASILAHLRRGFKSPAKNGKSTKVDSSSGGSNKNARNSRPAVVEVSGVQSAAQGDSQKESTLVDLVSVAGGLIPRRSDAALILLTWFGLPVAMMSYTNQAVHPYYQLIGLPAGFILAGWGLNAVFRPATRYGALLLLVALLPFDVLMGLNSLRYYEETAAIPGAHDLGALPLEAGMQLGALIREHLPPGGIVYADVDEWTLNSLSGRLFPVARDTRAPAFHFVPAAGGLYITSTPGVGMIIVPPGFSDPVETLVLADGAHLRVDRFPPLSAAADLCSGAQRLDAPSEQGIRLGCYLLRGSEDPLRWTLETRWRVDAVGQRVEARLYAPFVHVFDASGERAAIIDGEAVPGYLWQVGDWHVHRLVVTLPPAAAGPSVLGVGQYDSLSGENVIFRVPLADGSIDYTPLVELPETLPGRP